MMPDQDSPGVPELVRAAAERYRAERARLEAVGSDGLAALVARLGAPRGRRR